jgi:hypothetical protein
MQAALKAPVATTAKPRAIVARWQTAKDTKKNFFSDEDDGMISTKRIRNACPFGSPRDSASRWCREGSTRPEASVGVSSWRVWKICRKTSLIRWRLPY